MLALTEERHTPSIESSLSEPLNLQDLNRLAPHVDTDVIPENLSLEADSQAVGLELLPQVRRVISHSCIIHYAVEPALQRAEHDRSCGRDSISIHASVQESPTSLPRS